MASVTDVLLVFFSVTISLINLAIKDFIFDLKITLFRILLRDIGWLQK